MLAHAIGMLVAGALALGIALLVRRRLAREPECAICGQWPEAARPSMRQSIERLPLAKPICQECFMAFLDREDPEPKC